MLGNLKVNLIYLVGGMIIATFLILRFVPKPAVVAIPASQEVEQLKQKVAELTSQKKSVIKEYNCANGALSKETSVDELVARKLASSVENHEKKVEALVIVPASLELSFGVGAQLSISQFSDFNLDHVKPQLAVGAGFGNYSILAASDLGKNHAGYLMRVFKF